MALSFDRCIFEILGKLTAIQLNALCNFINSKVAVLENDIRNKLSITDSGGNDVVSALESLGTGIADFNDKIRRSSLFDIVRTLSPNCSPITEVFGGAFGLSVLAQQTVQDTTIVLKQITSASAQANNLKNQLLDVTAALKDICTIAQLIIQQKTRNPDELRENFDDLKGFFREETERTVSTSSTNTE